MGVVLLLRVVWISLLHCTLFKEAQARATARKTSAMLNLGETADFLEDLSFDEGEGNWMDKSSKVVNEEYKKSPAAYALKKFSVDQNLVTKPHSNVERIVGGASRRWESNVLEPITFPLKSSSHMVDQTRPKPLVYESQSSPLTLYGSRTPVPPSYSKLTTGIQKVKPKPVLATSLAVSPSFESVLPSSGVGDQFTGSIYQQQNLDSRQGVHSSNSASPGSVIPEEDDFSNLIELSAGNVPTRKETSWVSPVSKLQQESRRTPEWLGQGNEISSSAKVGQPIFDGSFAPFWFFTFAHPMPNLARSLPPKATESLKGLPLHNGFVVHSKNRYQRRRIQKSKLTYTPHYNMSKGKPGKNVQSSNV